MSEPEPAHPAPPRTPTVLPPDVWASWSDEQLMDLRMNQLGVSIEGSVMEGRIAELQAELNRRSLGAFVPHFWLSAEWFSPDGVPGVAIPFYLAHPRLERLERSGANIVGVAIRDRPEDTAAFLAAYGNPFSRIGRDDISQVQLSIGSSGAPETFVIDREGRVVRAFAGAVNGAEERAELRAAIEDALS